MHAIEHSYQFPHLQQEIDWLRSHADMVQITDSPRLVYDQTYYKQGIAGSNSKLYLREALYMRLLNALESLDKNLGFLVFDGHRTLECQAELFKSFYSQIAQQNAHLSQSELDIEVRKYVSHPDEPSRFAVPPHHSGGAVDLMLFDIEQNQPLDFGTEFDHLGNESRTDYFEAPYRPGFGISESRWHLVRDNRRLLFHILIEQGFTNFKSEWWHYDLGDCLWAQHTGSAWFYSAVDPSRAS